MEETLLQKEDEVVLVVVHHGVGLFKEDDFMLCKMAILSKLPGGPGGAPGGALGGGGPDKLLT